jgi:magnesium transporter
MAGLPPGSLVYTGEKTQEPVKISLVEYDEQNFSERQLPAVTDCMLLKDKPGVTWLNVSGISQVSNLEKLGECLRLHPLVLEDILNIDQRPKVEDYDDYLFIILKAIKMVSESGEIVSDQVSLILGPNYVLSFNEGNGELYKPIKDRLLAAKGRIRKYGADFLAYSLIDIIVDNYFVVLEQVGESIEDLEEDVVRRPTPVTLQGVHRFKNDMIILRKSLWPLREVVARLERRESPLITETTAVYCKDVYDHTIIAIDTVETYRDILSGMLDIYLSSVSNRLNEIMKVLTIIATIFMPLTFITSLYGMNFKHMPELEWQYGYLLVLILLVVITVMMLLFFRKKKWI